MILLEIKQQKIYLPATKASYEQQGLVPKNIIQNALKKIIPN